MKIEKQYLEDHQVKLTVEVEPEPLEEAKQRAARQISKKTKIPGFRPGKAPYHVILRTVGEPAILEDALEILVNDLYPKVIDQAEIKPYGPGQLEKMSSMEPPTFEFIVPLEAEVTLGNYHAIRIPYELSPIPEEKVDHVIDDLRSRQAVIEPIERPAQEGDQVYIRLSGERKQVDEGESPTLVNDRPYPVVIEPQDADSTGEWPFPGFSRYLIGLSAGDEKTIDYTYQGDAQWESLRGKEAQFQIVVESVKSRHLPELNDEFAQTTGEFESVDKLRSEIRIGLEKEAKEEYDSGYNDKIIDELLKDAVIKYPPQMLEHEVELFLGQLQNRISQQNMDMETYLKIRQLDKDGLRAEVRPLAEKRLKQTLVLFEIAKAKNIKVTNEEVEAESSRALGEISQHLPPEQVKKTLTKDFIRSMVGNIGADLLVTHTYSLLQSIAKGEHMVQSEETPSSESLDIEAEQINPKKAATAGKKTTKKKDI